MEESDKIITLIGTKLAKTGNEFNFKGGVKECEPCRLNKTCLGLNIGSRYRITALRNGGKLECYVHDSGVCAVEVIELPVEISVESRKAMKGSTITYEPVPCNITGCTNYVMCRPEGMRRGDKFNVVSIGEDISDSCDKGYLLKIAEVKRTT
ncbi:MAG: UPF0179 family protein [Euryarchaeota archaeon]|nr:UPF0179 family protein [Euryarchaeota archaeon]